MGCSTYANSNESAQSIMGGSMHILSERLGDRDGIDFIAPTAKNMRRPPEHILDQRRTVSQTKKLLLEKI